MLSNDPERRCGGFLEPGRLAPGGSASRLRGPGPWRPSLTRCRDRGNSVLGRRGVSPALRAGTCWEHRRVPASSPPLCHKRWAAPSRPHVVMAAAGGVPLRPTPLATSTRTAVLRDGRLRWDLPVRSLGLTTCPLVRDTIPVCLCHCFVHYPLHRLTPAGLLHQSRNHLYQLFCTQHLRRGQGRQQALKNIH